MPLPYAYVVEYRVADACFPPDCRIDGRRVFGRATAADPSAGAYVAIGSDKNELFARRGMVLRPSGEISFTLPARAEASVLDMSLACTEPGGGPFRAALEIRGADRQERRVLEGTTAAFEPVEAVDQLGREQRYFMHVRESLSPRESPITVSIRNDGKTAVGVGAPLVLRRVEGRGPRQAFVVIFDAVPYLLLDQIHATADPDARWLSSFVTEGTLFPQAISPGQLTGSFVRRFFRGDFYRLEGDPPLLGQGFDEAAPERAPGPIARLAEQGFYTAAIGANLYLSPVLSRIGFDVDYNVEPTEPLQIHPPVLASRFEHEMEAHADDDAVFVVWYANTHAPWRAGRREAPPFDTSPFRRDEVDLDVLEPIWKNLFDAVSSLRRIVERTRTKETQADRVWMLTADHGHTFSLAARRRPWRLTRELVANGHMHCCLATEQEARTPLVLVEEGEGAPASLGGRGKVEERPISTMAAWSAVERRFGVDLDLPRTSAFALPHEREPRFDDGIIVSVGNSGALFGRHENLTYRAYRPAEPGVPVWTVEGPIAHLLRGSPAPVGGIPAEELYDVALDPGETTNLAAARFDALLAMRARMAHWLAAYGDGPLHERHAYTLVFARKATVAIDAPRPFTLEVDGRAAPVTGPVTAEGTIVGLREGERPLGVVDLRGGDVAAGLLVRCGASGLPLARIDARNARLDLALARTNCVGATTHAAPAHGEAIFRAELVARSTPARAANGALPELKRALERWGYVREK